MWATGSTIVVVTEVAMAGGNRASVLYLCKIHIKTSHAPSTWPQVHRSGEQEAIKGKRTAASRRALAAPPRNRGRPGHQLLPSFAVDSRLDGLPHSRLFACPFTALRSSKQRKASLGHFRVPFFPYTFLLVLTLVWCSFDFFFFFPRIVL